jgi:hypothetical protein
MKDEELAAMQARVDAVTPGPWRISGDESVYSDDETMEWAAETTDDPGIPSYPPERHTADAAFIAAARADIPALLAGRSGACSVVWAVRRRAGMVFTRRTAPSPRRAPCWT